MRAKELLFISILMGLFVVLAEGAVRLAGLAPFLPGDPETPLYYHDDTIDWYRVRPGLKYNSVIADGLMFGYHTNEHGMRSESHSYENPQQKIRILALGDSFTYGIGAPYESTFLRILEKRLNRDQDRHEVIKSGFMRYSSEPEKRFLAHYGVRFKPQVVMVGFVPNDVLDAYADEQSRLQVQDSHLITERPSFGSRIRMFFNEHAHLMRMAENAIPRLKAWIRNRPVVKRVPPVWAQIYQDGGRFERYWQKVENDYREMIRICRTIEAEFVILNIPQNPRWGSDQIPFQHAYAGDRMAALARREGVHFLDLLPKVRAEQAAGATLYHVLDGHFNSRGYHLAGEELHSFMSRQVLPKVTENLKTAAR
ncbi:MAG: SGNH/GDSL hydrolase family protein [Magnetococcales bacterium]|nr:SGNH/GDSL hydrolase family protein [Magnetococcales bacterium]